MYIHVFSWLLKVPSVGAWRISGGRLFQSRGATAKKARLRVFSLQASLGVRLLSLTSSIVAWRITVLSLLGFC